MRFAFEKLYIYKKKKKKKKWKKKKKKKVAGENFWLVR